MRNSRVVIGTRRVSARARELTLAREAIALVASGATPRVVLAGIRHGDDILLEAQRAALEQGVRISPLRRDDAPRTDLVIEPIS